ncbi:2-dehydropantoate 2-reductase [Tritonibacter mobilis]|uniref:2-dehydropantoate 2-reductase n=1 Tax=Tritonibacter mobilis TaxID=379347 RepID=UPI001402E52C|nr:2-dehydropantoate 2-reductase [Tritonibacter mobilis]NHM20187.1 2-dehydropantoate 2-reductase [Tritonibacter mobilis]NHM24351.1 2-dehydropantoate 2-reductase [Tritonibacter mobilis]
MSEGHIVVLGAPALAGFCAGLWAAAGHRVTWGAAPQTQAQFERGGLRLTDPSGLDARIGPDVLDCLPVRDALRCADLVVLQDLDELEAATVWSEITSNAPAGTMVLNVTSATSANCALPPDPTTGRRMALGLAPWSVNQHVENSQDEALWIHRYGAGGPMRVAEEAGIWARDLSVPCLDVKAQSDISGVIWGSKLAGLLPLCASLAGIAPRALLQDRVWRNLCADLLEEVLVVLRKAGIRPKPARGLPLFWRLRALRVGGLLNTLAWPEVSMVPGGPAKEADLSLLQDLSNLGARVGMEMPVSASLLQADVRGG